MAVNENGGIGADQRKSLKSSTIRVANWLTKLFFYIYIYIIYFEVNL